MMVILMKLVKNDGGDSNNKDDSDRVSDDWNNDDVDGADGGGQTKIDCGDNMDYVGGEFDNDGSVDTNSGNDPDCADGKSKAKLFSEKVLFVMMIVSKLEQFQTC